MPGLKGRLSTVVKSKISKQLDRAENPNETLDYAYQRQSRTSRTSRRGSPTSPPPRSGWRSNSSS